jgi:branched-chain amino acid aminotransferase
MSLDSQALWYVNGRWVHPEAAAIPVNDVALLRGYSIFETLRTYDRRPFHLQEHLDRLYRSARYIDLDLPYGKEEIASIVNKAIEYNSYKQASVRVLVTGGESEDSIIPTGTPTLSVLITPLAERDMEKFDRGIRVITTPLQREVPEAKTTNYIAAIRALKQAMRQGATDALFVNEHGQVLESTRSNFFIFRGDTLITPLTGILMGVTRGVVLDLARGHFQIEERPIRTDELTEADEAFITGSSREITPVVQIDDKQIGTGRAGKHTTYLEKCFIDLVDNGAFV